MAQLQHSAQKPKHQTQLQPFLPAWSACVFEALQEQLLADQPLQRPLLPQPQKGAELTAGGQGLTLEDQKAVAAVEDLFLADFADEFVQKGQD